MVAILGEGGHWCWLSTAEVWLMVCAADADMTFDVVGTSHSCIASCVEVGAEPAYGYYMYRSCQHAFLATQCLTQTLSCPVLYCAICGCAPKLSGAG